MLIDQGARDSRTCPINRHKPMIRQFLGSAKRQSQHLFEVAQYGLSQKVSDPSRFVIFGRGRSGSTALVSLLNALPNVHCDGEVLKESLIFPYFQILAKCQRSAAAVYGCKILSYQIRKIQPIPYGSVFLRDLYEDGFKIIYLKRDNLVQHAISIIRAKQYGFHQKVSDLPLGQNKPEKVRIDTNELLRLMQDSQALNQYERLVLSDIPHLALTYEADMANERRQQRAVDKICDFLSISRGRVTCQFRKVSPRQLSDSVSNYDEVVRFLARSSYIRYIRQDLLMTSQ